MARALIAYLKRSEVPARKPLQQAINALQFPLTLDDTYAPFETAGYLPCTLDGEDAGFDLRFKEAAAGQSGTADIGERDIALWLKWGGDPREEAAALIVCAALVKNFAALVLADAADESLNFEQLLARIKSALA